MSTKIDESKCILLVLLIGLARFSYVTVPVWVAVPASSRVDLGTERHPSPGRLWYIGSTLHLAKTWTWRSILCSHVAQTVDISRRVELRFDKVYRLTRVTLCVLRLLVFGTRVLSGHREELDELVLSSFVEISLCTLLNLIKSSMAV